MPIENERKFVLNEDGQLEPRLAQAPGVTRSRLAQAYLDSPGVRIRSIETAGKLRHVFSFKRPVDGQMGPNAGTRQQTIYRLFGGDPEAWAAFDPKTLMMQHGRYQGISGWFAVSGSTTPVYRAGAAKPRGIDIPEPNRSNTGDNTAVAQYMCALASSYGIECAVVPDPGNHDFQHAVRIFGSALPWLAGKLGTPGVPSVPLPGAPQS